MTPEERRLAATIMFAHGLAGDIDALRPSQSDDDSDDKQKGGKR